LVSLNSRQATRKVTGVLLKTSFLSLDYIVNYITNGVF